MKHGNTFLGILLGLLLAVPLGVATGPMIEARLFPVATDIRIAERVDFEDGRIGVRLSANRHRECERVDSAWFVQVVGRYEHADDVVPPDRLPPNPPAGLNVGHFNVLPGPGV